MQFWTLEANISVCHCTSAWLIYVAHLYFLLFSCTFPFSSFLFLPVLPAALSDRGTVVLEAAMASALSTLEHATSERSRAEASCRGCVPCLFQNCGQLSGSCCECNIMLTCLFNPDHLLVTLSHRSTTAISWCVLDVPFLSTASSSNALSEPSCEVISKAQKLQGEAERSWALSQACAYYQHRCPPGEADTESCIRVMGESCSARVLQCSLLNTMQNLEPAMQTHAQGERRHLFTHAEALDLIALHRFSPAMPVLCPSSSVRSEVSHSAKCYAASLQDCGRLSCTSRQLALAG